MMPTPINPAVGAQDAQNLELELTDLAKQTENSTLAEKIIAIRTQFQKDQNQSRVVDNLSRIFQKNIAGEVSSIENQELIKNPTFQKSYCIFLKNHGNLLPQNEQKRVILEGTQHLIPSYLLSSQSDSYAQFLSGDNIESLPIPTHEGFDEKAREVYCLCLENVSSEGRITPENVKSLLWIAKHDGTAWLMEDCYRFIKEKVLTQDNAFEWLREGIKNHNQSLYISSLALLAEKYVPKTQSNWPKVHSYLSTVGSMMDLQRPSKKEIEELSKGHCYRILDFIFDPTGQQLKMPYDMQITEKGIEIRAGGIEDKEPPEVVAKNREWLKKIMFNGTHNGDQVPLHLTLLSHCFDVNFLKEILAPNPALTSLDLSSIKIGPKEALVVAEGIRNNPNLKSLNLAGCQLGRVGAKIIANALRGNNSLTSINLARNGFNLEAVQYLLNALESNKSLRNLSLEGNNLSNEGAQAIAQMLSRANSKLNLLNLAGCSIGAEGAIAIAEALKVNRSLTFLSLAVNNIQSAGAQAILDMLMTNVTLTHLNLFQTQGDQWLSIQPLEVGRKNTTLVHLNFGFNNLNSPARLAFANMLKEHFALTSLDFSNTRELTDLHIRSLMTNPTLTSLTLNDCGNINKRGIETLADALSSNSKLAKLSLTGTYVEDWVNILSVALQKNTTLTHFEPPKLPLQLDYRDVKTVKYIRPFLEALHINRSLLSVKIRGDYSYLSGETIKEIQDILKRNAETLNLPKKFEWSLLGSIGSYDFNSIYRD